VLDHRAVDGADHPTRRHHAIGIIDERLNHSQKGIVVENRIGVDHAHKRMAGGVQPHVERV